jgi:hypothetical protein
MTTQERVAKQGTQTTRTTDALLGGLIAAVLAATIGYLGLIVLELGFASGNGLSELPPPTRWWLRLLLLVAATAVGVVVARRELAASEQAPRVPLRIAVLVLLVAGLVLPTAAYGQSRERVYLDATHADDANWALDVGHDACDWLADRRWGEPNENSELRLPAGIKSQGGIDSTRVWFSYYVRYLDQQNPGPLTESERAQLSLTVSAWYELCPFQQWVHRPVGGDPDD